jgi:exodeoxyribonuclease VII small subunit
MPRTQTPASATPDTPAFDFEASMAELEGVVGRLEQGELPLEEALAAFERGIALTRACQQALREAEQKVEVLTARADGEPALAPFAATDGPEP